uniref:Uncharacterized protein LOC101494640 n=1 Tax=Cicer arietinum TaxID=3827 RepID=A0A1S2YV62_CICAR|nr:uncharacterized protein LOC101494640 [Cicer arietinum]
MDGVVIQNGAQQVFTRYQNQGNWLEQMRGSLMVVATVIASLTFQIAINPPGGVWQTNTNKTEDGCAFNTTCKAGTSVIASSGDSDQKFRYEVFTLLCAISFSASQTIILLLVTGFQLSNKFVMWLLIIVNCISVFCTAGAYIISIWMIMYPLDGPFSKLALYYGLFWALLVVLIFLGFFCRLVFWLLKSFFRLLCCCLRRKDIGDY